MKSDPTAVARVKIWDRAYKVVYSDDHDLIGRTFPPSDELEDALRGEVASEVSSLEKQENSAERGLDQSLLEVYVPLRFGSDVLGAFEIYRPYRPVEAEITHQTRRLMIVLLAGLSFLYVALYRIVSRASRTLRRQADENAYQATHDSLTDLPNRTLFLDRVTQALLTSRRDGAQAAVMILDIDGFKEINDTLGHRTGDAVLKQVGARLRLTLRESDSVARLGGDEFAVLLPRVTNGDAALEVADKALRCLEDPFPMESVSLDLGASAGISMFPGDGDGADVLLQRAEVAMYRAKQAGRSAALYAAADDHYDPARLALAADLRRAMSAPEELVVHYQPQADMTTGLIRSVEALVRWQHPERGLLPPDQFVPLAEVSGLIGPLTAHVLDRALAQCSEWRDAGYDLAVSVNLSARSLHDPKFAESVAAALAKWNLPPSALEVEITEKTLVREADVAGDVLRELKETGVRVAIDDFGIEYSSLSYLKRLPVDAVKIDKSFVLNMLSDQSDVAIVRSTIELSHRLGLQVVAEGVETEEVWHDLTSLDCDLAQGYLLTRPLPAADLEKWLEKWSAPRPDDGSAVMRGGRWPGAAGRESAAHPGHRLPQP